MSGAQSEMPPPQPPGGTPLPEDSDRPLDSYGFMREKPPDPELFDRGFSLVESKLDVFIDVERSEISGRVLLTIAPTDPDVVTAVLNFRHGKILNVTVNGRPARFDLTDPLRAVPSPTLDPELRELGPLMDRYREAWDVAERGELAVTFPSSVAIRQAASTAPSTPRGESRVAYETIDIEIEYLVEGLEGIFHLTLPDTDTPDRVPQFVLNNGPGLARCWMPCVDSLVDACPWEMRFTVADVFVVAASGLLVRQELDSINRTRTFCYLLDSPAAARNIAVAGAPFEILVDAKLADATHFVLPGLAEEGLHVAATVPRVVEFCHTFLGVSFPVSAYNQAFLEETFLPSAPAAAMSVFSTSFLHDHTIIDHTLVAREALAYAVARQWFGVLVRPRFWQDYWIVIGCAGYLSLLFARHSLGNNEFKWRVRKQMDRVLELERAGLGRPLCDPSFTHPSEITESEYIFVKAPIMIYMLARRIGADKMRALLNELCARAVDNPMGLGVSVTTSSFILDMQRVSALDLEQFAHTWIYNIGAPEISCAYWFNRKRTTLEFVIRQENTTPESCYKGPLTLRAHEFDSTLDHICNLTGLYNYYEFQIASKHRRARKKKITLDNREEVVVDVTYAIDSPVLWFRPDPDLDFIHNIYCPQNGYMLVYQMMFDRDVVAQEAAMTELGEVRTLEASQAIAAVVTEERCFYRVRVAAVHALANCACAANGWHGVDFLIKFFKKKWFVTTVSQATGQRTQQVRPNDFSDLVMYHIQAAIPRALATVRHETGETPQAVFDFLMDVLRFNDNGSNEFSDAHYAAGLVRALADVRRFNRNDIGRVADELDRYLNMENLMPCFQNLITIACIEVTAQLQAAGVLDRDLRLFREYAHGHGAEEVRVASQIALMRLCDSLVDATTLRNFLEAFAAERVPHVRGRLLDALIEELPEDMFDHFEPLPVRTGNTIYCAAARDAKVVFETIFDGMIASANFALARRFRSLYWKMFGEKDTPPCFDSKMAGCTVTIRRPFSSKAKASMSGTTLKVAMPSPSASAPSISTPKIRLVISTPTAAGGGTTAAAPSFASTLLQRNNGGKVALSAPAPSAEGSGNRSAKRQRREKKKDTPRPDNTAFGPPAGSGQFPAVLPATTPTPATPKLRLSLPVTPSAAATPSAARMAPLSGIAAAGAAAVAALRNAPKTPSLKISLPTTPTPAAAAPGAFATPGNAAAGPAGTATPSPMDAVSTASNTSNTTTITSNDAATPKLKISFTLK